MSAKMRDMKFRKSQQDRSHPGQRRSAPRKRANQVHNLKKLEKEAAALGVTVLQLRAMKAREAADEQKRILLAEQKAAAERATRQGGYYRYGYGY